MKIDLKKVDTMIREVATTEIMPRFQKLAAGDVQMKGINDPVTVADQESERQLTLRLTNYLPGSVVVGEESVANDKNVLARLSENMPTWIIDPIDGTRNFVEGKPEFAVMVALLRDREPVAAWIHDPNSGDTIMAEEGSGVWLRDQRMHVAAKDQNAAQELAGLVGSRVKKLISDPDVMPRDVVIPRIEIGSCSGFDYPRLFTGTISFANNPKPRASFLFYRHTNAWDHLPGLFLYREAGGYSANWAGKPYDMRNNREGLLHAKDKEEWFRLHKVFEPLMDHVGVKDASTGL